MKVQNPHCRLNLILELFVSLLFFALPLCGQRLPLALDEAVPVKEPPKTGTFYSVALPRQAPLPFNPFPELPVYHIHDRVYVYDDRSVDYELRRAMAEAASLTSPLGLSEEGGADSGGMMMMSGGGGPPGLKLTAPVVSGPSLLTSLIEADTNSAYDIFQKQKLLPAFAWQVVGAGGVGQTNFAVPRPASDSMFYRAASALDSDSDGLSDAFEQLIAGTNPALYDSDGDGLSDAGEDHNGDGIPNYAEAARRVAVCVYASRATATEGGMNGEFTVLLPQPAPPGGVTVQYMLTGNAIPSTEFALLPGPYSLAVPAGASSAVIGVTAVNDSLCDDLERVVELRITNATPFAVDQRPAAVTLIDNDPPTVRVIAVDFSASEPRPGTNDAGEFLFVRDTGFNQALTIFFSVGGSAVNGTDYGGIGNAVAIASGQRSVTLNITPLTDALVEGPETVALSLVANGAYSIDPAGNAATVTITDEDLPVVQVVASDPDAREAGPDAGQFQFTRTGATSLPLTVNYAVHGTASSSNFTYTLPLGVSNVVRDYTPLPGAITIPAGASSATLAVMPLADALVEPMETVIVTLRGGTNYLVGANNTGAVLLDDNNPTSYGARVTRRTACYHAGAIDTPAEVIVTRYGTSRAASDVGYWVTNTYSGQPWVNWHHVGGNVNPGSRRILFGANASEAVFLLYAGPGVFPFGACIVISNSPAPGVPRILDDCGFWFTNANNLLYFSALSRVATEGGTPAVVRVNRHVVHTAPFNFRLRVTGTAQPDLAVGNGFNATMPANAFFVDVAIPAPADAIGEGWESLYVDIDPLQQHQAGDTRPGFVDCAQLFFRDASVPTPQPPVDTDQDGLTDAFEFASGLDTIRPNDPYADPDRDGLSHLEEQAAGSSSSSADTDGDGHSDYFEFLSDSRSLTNSGLFEPMLENSVPIQMRVSSCYKCHRTGLQAGDYTLFNQPPSRPIAEEVQRFAKGRSYPVRVLVEQSPFGQQGLQSYEAALLAATNPPGFYIDDPNGLLGQRFVTTNHSTKLAWLHVPRIELAVDANRDGAIRFLTNTTDLTTAAKPYTFWLNEDRDSGSDNQAEDLDPAGGGADGADAFIVNERDLEDFTRLHLRVDAVSGAQLAAGTLSLTLEWRSVSNTPSLRLFRAVEADGGTNYLVNTAVSGQQIISPWNSAVGAVSSGAALTLPASYRSGATGSNFLRYFLYEGVAAGNGQLVAVLKQGGTPVAESAPVHLRLRKVTDLFEHFTIGDNITTEWNSIPPNYTPTGDSGTYTASSSESSDYILFVHGWRMLPWERRAFAHTAYKRLWWAGYRGRFGLFSWPTDWVDDPLWLKLLDPQNYDRSERRAWKSAYALQRLLVYLNERCPARVRALAHSMGAIVASEALHHQAQTAALPVLHTFVASQGASVAHAYDAMGPETIETDATTDTPEVYAHYPTNNLPYLKGMARACPNIVNYHNFLDYALDKWELNQDTKPDAGWLYSESMKKWFRVTTPIPLNFPPDTYEIFAYIAESRSRALGSAVDATHSVGVEVRDNLNLNASFLYGNGPHEHSAQFRSTIQRRRSYWSEILRTSALTP